MEKLNFQDAAFLRLENPQHPFHVGGLMIFSPPQDATANYLRRLMEDLGRELPRLDALFRRKLEGASSAAPYWVEASDYDPAEHLQHYALPRPARMQDLLTMLSRAHERQLDRSKPMWEWHLVEGLPRNRFALYGKIHHSLIDGAGALRMLNTLLSHDPRSPIGSGAADAASSSAGKREDTGWFSGLAHASAALIEQGRALPELAAMLLRMRNDHQEDAPPLPFTAPHAIMNTDITHRRRILSASFPLATLRRIGARAEGTVNDALLAICGAALRSYLIEQGKLPSRSLLAGIPVSVRTAAEEHGNQLSTIVCSFGTTTRDPVARLRNISRATRKAKQNVRELSPTARQDYMNMILLPTVVLTLAHAANTVPPAFNVIVSNVPGPTRPLYLAGSRLREVYPLSVVTDAQALNITAVSCASRLCVGVTACPDNMPGIERLDTHLHAAYEELKRSLKL